jgi:hypothetical protein
MTSEGEFPKIDATILYPSEANMLNTTKIFYSGTALNFSQNIASGTFTGSYVYESNLLNPANLVGGSFIHVNSLYSSSAEGDRGATNAVSYSIEFRPSGGVYESGLPFVTINSISADNAEVNTTRTANLNWIHPLSVQDLTSGIQLKLISKYEKQGASQALAIYTNYHTTIAISK